MMISQSKTWRTEMRIETKSSGMGADRSRWILKILTLVACVGLAGGLNLGSTAANAKDYHFAFANIFENGDLFKSLGDGFAFAAKETGFTLSRYNNNNDGETTINNARLMVQENPKPDVIFEYTGVAGIGPALNKVFSQAKTPCVAVNIPLQGCHWFNLVNETLCGQSADPVIALAKEKGWTGDNTTAILIQGASLGRSVNNCVGYFYAALSKALPGFQKAEMEDITASTTTIGKTGIQVDGKATLEGSYEVVKNVLQAIPADRHIVVYSINDDSTMGGWRAVSEAGRGPISVAVGLGGSEASLKQLRTNPQWIGEGSIFFPSWGEFVMAMGVALTNGAKPPELTHAPQLVLTKSNVDKYYDAAGRAILLPPLDSTNVYLKDTGILQKFKNVEGL
jgi:ribose transport system substrate-binding protein